MLICRGLSHALARASLGLRLGFLFGALLMGGMSCRTEPSGKLTIAASANMQFALEEIVRNFTEETGVDCELIIGSSGKLTAQVRRGAPFDLFLSADMRFPQRLYEEGLVSRPRVYAYGQLVLWSMEGQPPSLGALSGDDVGHVALPDPGLAPYGRAAIEALKRSGVQDRVAPKLVFGESIAQTNQLIQARAVGTGFTARSVVMAPALRDKGRWRGIDTCYYGPIAQGLALVYPREGRRVPSEAAEKFRDFIFSDRGRAVLEDFGYLLPLGF